jgi:hypothetical protein
MFVQWPRPSEKARWNRSFSVVLQRRAAASEPLSPRHDLLDEASSMDHHGSLKQA